MWGSFQPPLKLGADRLPQGMTFYFLFINTGLSSVTLPLSSGFSQKSKQILLFLSKLNKTDLYLWKRIRSQWFFYLCLKASLWHCTHEVPNCCPLAPAAPAAPAFPTRHCWARTSCCSVFINKVSTRLPACGRFRSVSAAWTYSKCFFVNSEWSCSSWMVEISTSSISRAVQQKPCLCPSEKSWRNTRISMKMKYSANSQRMNWNS